MPEVETPQLNVAVTNGLSLSTKDNLSIPNPFEKPQYTNLVDNEFNNTNIPILDPFKKNIIIQTDKGNVNLDPILARDFSYLSRTRQMEVNTAKTQELQNIVDKFGAITGNQARVVVMNKGTEREAFVYPDGTIFISQSILNTLDSIDEIAAVLAHEMGHLKNKTTEKAIAAGNQSGGRFLKLGVKWVHEMASDSEAVTLLEQAGYNSFAFAYAIDKLAGTTRGYEHQSGLARASESLGYHMSIHSKTSNLPLTPKPDLLRAEVKKTNQEIVFEMIKNPEKVSVAEFNSLVEKLHPQDLENSYRLLVYRFEANENSPRNQKAMLVIFNNLLSQRLAAKGFGKEEINYFLLVKSTTRGAGERTYSPNFYLLGNSPEAITALAKKFADLDTSNRQYKLSDMSKTVFDNQGDYLQADELLSLIRDNMYDTRFISAADGIPLTQESLFNTLEIVSQAIKDRYSFSESTTINQILVNYLLQIYFENASAADTDVDSDQIIAFWEEVKQRGIKVDPQKTINDCYSVKYKIKHKTKIGEEIPQELQNKSLIYEGFCQAFGIELKDSEKVDKDYIDNFFNKIQDKLAQNKGLDTEDWQTFAFAARHSFIEQELTETQRLEYLDYISQKIASLNLKFEFDRYDYQLYIPSDLEGNNQETRIGNAVNPDRQLNEDLRKLNLKLFMGLVIFPKDTPEFYSYMEQAMNQSGIDPEKFSKTQLLNLVQGFFEWEILIFTERFPNYVYLTSDGSNKVKLEDFNRLLSLPLFKAALGKADSLNCTSLKELNQVRQELLLSFHVRTNRNKVFEDTRFALIAGKAIREKFVEILGKGLTDNDLAELFLFVDESFPDGNEKQQVLTAINRKYLSSPAVSFDKKVDYLIANFDRIGLEGMVIVAETITDINTYQEFRRRIGEEKINEYLSGSRIVAAAAGVDIASSLFASSYNRLFATGKNDAESQKEISTNLAEQWFSRYFYRQAAKLETYKQEQRFNLSGEARLVFKSYADIVGTLKNLSPLQRFVVAHKELTEERGAFSSPENKKELAKLLLSSLGLQEGFITAVLSTACQEGDPKIIAFPAAQMLSKLLFRAYNINAVDIDHLAQCSIRRDETSFENIELGSILTPEDFKHILSSTTRELYNFGAVYASQPDCLLFRSAQESDTNYRQSLDTLTALLKTDKGLGESQTALTEQTIDTSLEAVIKGVEASGALGVRALQLASQFHRFSPDLAKRLEQCFDNTSVLNTKLAVWENLYRFGQDNPGIQAVLGKMTLLDRLGGGSLQSTWEAEIEGEQTVIKVMAPNAEAFVHQRFDLAKKVLEEVLRKSRSPQVKEAARKGLTLVKLSKDWCLKDIQDPTYAEDDDIFRAGLSEFDQSFKTVDYYAPERRFTSPLLKVEIKGKGKTLNRFLQDQQVDFAKKQEAVKALGQFFGFQMEKQYTDESGKTYYMFHADPHVGNYLVDLQDGKLQMGVIDRHMYLKLQAEDVNVLKKLVTGGNDNDFVYSFVDRILDLNNKQNPIQRRLIAGKVIGTVGKDYWLQKSRGKIDRFSLLGTMLTEFSRFGLEVPLELRLMIRNIGALKELMSRYNLTLET